MTITLIVVSLYGLDFRYSMRSRVMGDSLAPMVKNRQGRHSPLKKLVPCGLTERRKIRAARRDEKIDAESSFLEETGGQLLELFFFERCWDIF